MGGRPGPLLQGDLLLPPTSRTKGERQDGHRHYPRRSLLQRGRSHYQTRLRPDRLRRCRGHYGRRARDGGRAGSIGVLGVTNTTSVVFTNWTAFLDSRNWTSRVNALIGPTKNALTLVKPQC